MIRIAIICLNSAHYQCCRAAIKARLAIEYTAAPSDSYSRRHSCSPRCRSTFRNFRFVTDRKFIRRSSSTAWLSPEIDWCRSLKPKN